MATSILWIILTVTLLVETPLGYKLDGESQQVRFKGPRKGEHCGGKFCPSVEASCVEGRCQCKEGAWGNGALGCHAHKVWCAATSDPFATNFQHGHFEIAAPCRFRMALYTMFSPQKKGYKQQCTVTLQATNTRYLGKFFTAGFDVNFRINQRDEKEGFSITYRAVGWFDVAQDKYFFQRRMRIGVGSWFVPEERRIRYDYNFQTNKKLLRLDLDFPECGFHLNFRPAHPLEGKDQTNLPGILFSVDENQGGMKWTGKETTMCMSPPGEGPTLKELADQYGYSVNAATAVLTLFAVGMRPPFLPPVCDRLLDVVDSCTRSDNFNVAIDVCKSLLTQPIFVNCYSRNDPPGEVVSITGLYKRCLKSLCSGDLAACEEVRKDLLAACPKESDLKGVVLADRGCPRRLAP